MKVIVSILLTVSLLVSCADQADNPEDYLVFSGGGFIYNYRLATADYGFIAKVKRELPKGAIVEAEFENPNGGAPFILEQKAHPNLKQYYFRTPEVEGVVAGKEYQVELRILSSENNQLLASYQKTFHADLDQGILPDVAPVVGPGYHTNPVLTTE